MNMLNGEGLKTVSDLGGAVRFDSIMRTYIIRIPALNLPSISTNLFVDMGDSQEKLDYDATRNVYFNNHVVAESIEVVENARVVMK